VLKLVEAAVWLIAGFVGLDGPLSGLPGGLIVLSGLWKLEEAFLRGLVSNLVGLTSVVEVTL
jgi:hypothetical protein